MKTAKLCIQCTDTISREEGSFLAEPILGLHRAVSPVFPDLTYLYAWCKSNGWVEAGVTKEFPTGTYKKEEPHQ